MQKLKEIWKPIKDHNGYYEVSNYGKVRSLTRVLIDNIGRKKKYYGRIRKQTEHNGYLSLILSKNRSYQTVWIHKLVWDHFGDAPRNGMKLQVDHIDEDKQNNRIDNLQLLTNRENCSKGYKNKRTSSKHTGVHWCNSCKRWVAKIYINGKSVYLGRSKSEIIASNLYRRRLNEIHNTR